MESGFPDIEGGCELSKDKTSCAIKPIEANNLTAIPVLENIGYANGDSQVVPEGFNPSCINFSNAPTKILEASTECLESDQVTTGWILKNISKVINSLKFSEIKLGNRGNFLCYKFVAAWFIKSYRRLVRRVLRNRPYINALANDENFNKASSFRLLQEFILRNKELFSEVMHLYHMKNIGTKNLFSIILIAESFELYVSYLFSDSAPDKLCALTGFSCCRQSIGHDAYCEKNWNKLGFVMKQEFIEDILGGFISNYV